MTIIPRDDNGHEVRLPIRTTEILEGAHIHVAPSTMGVMAHHTDATPERPLMAGTVSGYR